MATFPTAANRKKKPLEYHFVDMNDPDRYKKLKVARACDFCRRRKSKCDVGIPGSGTCSNCQKHQMVCIFSPVSSVKWSRGAEHPAHPEVPDRAMDPSKSSPTAVSLTSTHRSSTPSHLYFDFPLLRVDPCGAVGYEANPSNADELATAWEATVESDSLLSLVPEPSSQLENMLFETYFEHVHPYFPVLHKQSILDRLHQDRRLLPVSLRCAVMAIACHFSPHALGTFAQASSSARVFHQRARYHIDHFYGPSIATVQVLLLLYKYRELCRNSFGAMDSLALSDLERVHVMLNHLPPQHLQTHANHQDELLTRAHWTLYIIVSLSNPLDERARQLRSKLTPPTQLPSILDDEFHDSSEFSTMTDFVELTHATMLYSHNTTRNSDDGADIHHYHDEMSPNIRHEAIGQTRDLWTMTSTKPLHYENGSKTGAVRAAYVCILYDMADLLQVDNGSDVSVATAARVQQLVFMVEQADMFSNVIQGKRIAAVALFLSVQVHAFAITKHLSIRADEGGTSDSCISAIELLEKMATKSGAITVAAALHDLKDTLLSPSPFMASEADHPMFFQWPSTPSLVPEGLPEIEWALTDAGPTDEIDDRFGICEPQQTYATFDELHVDRHENPITPTHPLGPERMPSVYETDYFQAWTTSPIDDELNSPPPSFQVSHDCAAIPSQFKSRIINNLHLPTS